MKKQILKQRHSAFDDVVPAFLSPDHMLRDVANDAPLVLLDPALPEDVPPSDFMIREGIHAALERGFMDLFLQPIVTLPQRHTKFYELLGRLRVAPGVYADAKNYLKMVNEDYILSGLDALILSEALRVLKKLQRREDGEEISLFINVRPFTLRSSVFMDSLLPLLAKRPDVARALVFEMRFSDFLTLSPAEQKILRGLQKVGCRFSVDHIHHMPEDIKYLRSRGIHFVKLDARMILSAGRSEEGFSRVLSQKHNLEVNGIDMIACKMEKQDALLNVLDYDVKYGQGFLFGKPDFQGVYI